VDGTGFGGTRSDQINGVKLVEGVESGLIW